jgi:uncharacterized protein YsxB (DUF464 family)
MTQAVFVKQGKDILSFEVEGHSGYAEEGSDIVCASVSSAVWMTVNALENILKVNVKYLEDDARVTCSVMHNSGKEAQVLLESLRQFLCNLSIEFGDYLTVKEVQKDV